MLRRAMLAFRATVMGRPAAPGPNPTLHNTWRQAWTRTAGDGGGGLRSIGTRAGTPCRRPLSGLWRRMQDSPRTLNKGPRVPLGRTRPTALRSSPRRSFHLSRPRRSNKVPASSKEGAEASLSLSQRMKKLSREYGWSAVGVYFTLSVLDFPFCFLLVKVVGTDKIAEIEHFVVSNVSQFIPTPVKDLWNQWRASRAAAKEPESGRAGPIEGDNWGVKEAQENYRAEAGLATQLALAYAVHKSFIFARVPLTAAVTPRVVKILRSWGWEIGKRRPKA